MFHDLKNWCTYYKLEERKKLYAFNSLLVSYKEFRNLIIARIRKESTIKSFIARFLFKPLEFLIFWTDKIGGGLFIEHGFSTIISAKEIG